MVESVFTLNVSMESSKKRKKKKQKSCDCRVSFSDEEDGQSNNYSLCFPKSSIYKVEKKTIEYMIP